MNDSQAVESTSPTSPGAGPAPETETFMSAASPGVVSLFFGNDFYPSDEEYVFAIADAMHHEYEAIAAAGDHAAARLPGPRDGPALGVRAPGRPTSSGARSP